MFGNRHNNNNLSLTGSSTKGHISTLHNNNVDYEELKKIDNPSETVRLLTLILWWTRIIAVCGMICVCFYVGLTVMLEQRTKELDQTIVLGHSILQQFNNSKTLDTVTMVVSDFNVKHYLTIQDTLAGAKAAADYIVEVVTNLEYNNSTQLISDIMKDAKKTASFISNVLQAATQTWVQQYIPSEKI